MGWKQIGKIIIGMALALVAQAQLIAIGTGASNEMAEEIIQTKDGGFAIVGSKQRTGNVSPPYDVYLVKLDADGNLLWQKAIGGSTSDYGSALIQTNDGGFAIVGASYSYRHGISYSDVYVIKLDSTGSLQWAKAIGGTNDEDGYDIVQTSDQGYVIVGERKVNTNHYIYLIKLDSLGNIQWEKQIGQTGAGTSISVGYSIIETIDGGLAIAGRTSDYGQGSWDVYVVKLDAMGNLQWSRTIGGTGIEEGYSIIQTNDNGYAIVGKTSSFGQGTDIYVIKLDASGNLQWAKTIGGAYGDIGKDIIQTFDGGYAIVGRTGSYGQGNWDIYIVKLDSMGNFQWSRTIGGTDYDEGRSILESSDGSLIVTGSTKSFGYGSGNNFDIFVLKLDSNGNINVGSCVAVIADSGMVSIGGDTLSGATISVLSNSALNGWNFVSAASNVYVCTPLNPCAGFTASVSKQDASCAGYADGWIKVQPIGGTPPYSHSWNPIPPNSNAQGDSIWNLTPGVWIDTLRDANGCEYIVVDTIKEPLPLVVNIDTSNVPLLKANVSGGTPPYSYSWSTGATTDTITIPQSGIYWVSVTDTNGCISSDTVNVIITKNTISTAIQQLQWYINADAELWTAIPEDALPARLRLVGTDGRILIEQIVTQSGRVLIGKLPAEGIYLLQYISERTTGIEKILYVR